MKSYPFPFPFPFPFPLHFGNDGVIWKIETPKFETLGEIGGRTISGTHEKRGGGGPDSALSLYSHVMYSELFSLSKL